MSDNLPSKKQTPAPPRGPRDSAERSDGAPETFVSVHAQWSGPLPPPGQLELFDKVVPGGAERIFREFEAEAAHRRRLEERAVAADIRNSVLGRVSAMVFAILALATAITFAGLGYPWPATLFGGTTIAAVVTAFIWGRKPSADGGTTTKSDSKDRNKKK